MTLKGFSVVKFDFCAKVGILMYVYVGLYIPDKIVCPKVRIKDSFVK